MKLLLDMNLSPKWVDFFQGKEIAAFHWSNVGDPAASDEEIFKWAKEKGYVVFTHDLDFGAILAATKADAPSVVQIRTQDIMPDRVGELVLRTILEFKSQLEQGALITIDEIKSRVRILPLG